MADLFVSFVAITPKPSQVTPPASTVNPGGQDVGGLHSDIQANKVVTPGQPK